MAPSSNSNISYDDITATLAVSWVDENVLHVKLNREKALNAMSRQFWKDFRECFTRIGNDSRVRAVVISANGRIFTAGLDLKDAAPTELGGGEKQDAARKAFHTRREILEIQESFNHIEHCNKPVIVAIHSGCVGGGVDLAAACDIRYCSADAWFTIKEVDVGLAADVGTLARFPKIVGNDSITRELAYTARKFDAQEAKEIGFIGRIFPTKEDAVNAAIETAKLIASKSPVGVQGTKNALLYSRDHTVAEGNAYIANWNAFALQTEDLAKAMMSSLKKTKAIYPNL